ncbi:MAG: vanadium-dependent haloperoxidase [Actinomycetota bacterium]
MEARPTRRLEAVLLLITLTAALVVRVSAATADEADQNASSSGNVATRWMERTLTAVRSGSPALQTGTPGAGRTYAMTSAAMYDAINGIDTADGASTRGRALVSSYSQAPAGGSREAAASAAAYAVLDSLFSGNDAVRNSLSAAFQDEMAALGSDPAVESGRSWGDAVGKEIVPLRSGDGSQAPASRPGGKGPGVFPRPFSGTQFRDMTPFGVTSVAPYLSSGPPSLTSTEYADAFNEVKELGSLSDLNPERAAIARHWLAEGGTVRETGLWFKVALNVIHERGTVASLSDTARLLAYLGMGIGDSVATSWTDKFNWNYWRPGDAIRQASTDGNPLTAEDPTWSPRGGACPSGANVVSCSTFGGTPEHTSGTSTFAGAAATILATFYCSDRIPFSFVGEQPGAQPRFYEGFAQAAREAGRSRIYGGIHFQFSNDAGREAGKGIAQEIVRTRLLPADSGAGASAVCTGG